MQIDIVYVPQCPNLDRARSRLEEALDVTGVEASVREIEVATPEAAVEVGMRGTPTILIDGRDAFATQAEIASMSCRLYAVGDSVDGAPTVPQLIEVMVG